MSENQREHIDVSELIKSFQQILEELKPLDDWNFSNAAKLDRLNNRRHSLVADLIDLGLESNTSWAYGTDETNREISIAQETRPKRKKDAAINERFFYRAIGHLKDEIEMYISSLREFIEKAK